jgi:hypothetical protein
MNVMTTWSKDEPHKIAETDDLHISPFRESRAAQGTQGKLAGAIIT